jgi:cell division septal protein FtsQ
MINHHKLKKEWKRRKRVHKKNSNVAYGKKRKDFAWGGKNRNPMKQEGRGISGRVKIEMAILFLSVVGAIGLFLYHPFFHISKINLTGTQRLSSEEILDAVKGSLSYNKYFVLPAKSYFFVSTGDIENILKERFPLSDVTINKKFPCSLSIVVKERLSTIIYDNGQTFYFMGLTGKIVEPIRKVTDAEWRIDMQTVTSTNELGEEISEEKEIARYHTPDIYGITKDEGSYPIVFQKTEETNTLEINTDVLQEQYITELVAWYEALGSKQHFVPQYADITLPYEAIFYTAGPDIHITLEAGDSEVQIARFNASLQEIKNLSTISYIDVRFAGRVYWQ